MLRSNTWRSFNLPISEGILQLSPLSLNIIAGRRLEIRLNRIIEAFDGLTMMGNSRKFRFTCAAVCSNVKLCSLQSYLSNAPERMLPDKFMRNSLGRVPSQPGIEPVIWFNDKLRTSNFFSLAIQVGNLPASLPPPKPKTLSFWKPTMLSSSNSVSLKKFRLRRRTVRFLQPMRPFIAPVIFVRLLFAT